MQPMQVYRADVPKQPQGRTPFSQRCSPASKGWPKVLSAHICIIVFIFIFPLGHVAAREKESQDSSGGVLLLPAEFSWRAASVAPSARCPHTSKDCRSGNREFSRFTSEILVTKRKSFVSKDCR